jgi:uncharacterized membrane protein
MPLRTSKHIVTVRTAFFSGLLLLAPLAITVWTFSKIVEIFGGSFRWLFEWVIPTRLQSIPVVWDIAITVVMFGLITLFGFVSHYLFGKYLVDLGERVIVGIPGVSTVYNSVKQVVSTFSTSNRNTFSQVVLVQYPREGIWSVGFLTNKTQAEAQARAGRELWAVFVPTSPNPTSGFVLLLPPEEITPLDMSVGDGMKLVISGGAVVPPFKAPHAKTQPAHKA